MYSYIHLRIVQCYTWLIWRKHTADVCLQRKNKIEGKTNNALKQSPENPPLKAVIALMAAAAALLSRLAKDLRTGTIFSKALGEG